MIKVVGWPALPLQTSTARAIKRQPGEPDFCRTTFTQPEPELLKDLMRKVYRGRYIYSYIARERPYNYLFATKEHDAAERGCGAFMAGKDF